MAPHKPFGARPLPRLLAAGTLVAVASLVGFVMSTSSGRSQSKRPSPGERAAPGAAPSAAPSVSGPIVPVAGHSPHDPETAVAVLSPSTRAGMATTGRPPALRRAYDLLATEDPRGRFEGLRLLAELRPGEALPEILAYIEATADSERALLQRIAAVTLLGELEGISTGPELEALYEHGDEALRRAAARAREAQGDGSLVQRELDALQAGLEESDGALRARAAEQAAQLESPLALPVLLPLLDDPNSEVRAQAIEGLWRADAPARLAAIIPELERMLRDPVAHVRERARRALRALDPGVR